MTTPLEEPVRRCSVLGGKFAERDIRVLELTARGLPIVRVSARLNVSTGTAGRSLARVITAYQSANAAQAVASALACGDLTVEPRGAVTVTAPQLQVIGLVARGLSNARIAEELCVTVGAVVQYMYRLLSKFRADCRAHLVYEAYRAGSLVASADRTSLVLAGGAQ